MSLPLCSIFIPNKRQHSLCNSPFYHYNHAHTATTTLLPIRPRCLATYYRVAQGAGTKRLASAVITVHAPIGQSCACFWATPGVCVCVYVCSLAVRTCLDYL